MDTQSLIARRYAIAFLRTFGAQLYPQDLECCHALRAFLKNNTTALLLLKMPSVATSIKEQVLAVLFKTCSTTSVWHNLISLLIRDRRLFLLLPVLEYIEKLYAHYAGIAYCFIQSAQPLSAVQLEAVVRFTEKNTGKKIRYTYTCDPTMIAGIAVKGENFYWEHSVRRQLQRLQTTLMHKGPYGH